MPKILGMDISKNKPGFAIIDSETEELIFVNSYNHKDKSLKEVSNLMLKIVKELVDTYKPEMAIIEDSYMGCNIVTGKLLTFLHGVCCTVLFKDGVDVNKIANTSVRSYFGAKDKKELFEFICKKYNLVYKFKDDNDKTDAIAIALNNKNPKLKIY